MPNLRPVNICSCCRQCASQFHSETVGLIGDVPAVDTKKRGFRLTTIHPEIKGHIRGQGVTQYMAFLRHDSGITLTRKNLVAIGKDGAALHGELSGVR